MAKLLTEAEPHLTLQEHLLPASRISLFNRTAAAILLAGTAGAVQTAHAQASATATQTLTISAFAGATGTYTGIQSGRNAAVTAGADLSFLPIHRLFPTLEVRGTQVFDSGAIAGERNILAGLKLSARLGRLHPYGNLLLGRGSIAYLGDGLPKPGTPIVYTLSHSTVYSPGVGVDLDVTSQLSLKLDGQYQRYSTPVTTSGSAYAKAGTVAVVYRFDFNRHYKIGAR